MEKAVWKLSPQLWNADLESSAIFLTFAHQIILTHMSYPICFVSLGPGDPELITLKGLKKLRQADIIYCPATISKSGQLLSRAARIIEELEIEKSVVQFFTLPMSKDRTEVWKVYDTLYEKAISARDKEKRWSLWRKAMQGSILPYSIYTTNSKRTASKWNEPPEYQLSLQRVL